VILDDGHLGPSMLQRN